MLAFFPGIFWYLHLLRFSELRKFGLLGCKLSGSDVPKGAHDSLEFGLSGFTFVPAHVHKDLDHVGLGNSSHLWCVIAPRKGV
jgi:hypothetical protein